MTSTANDTKADRPGSNATELTTDKIRQLLAAVGSEQAQDTAQTEVTEYDWSQPHCFSRDQLTKIDDLTTELGKQIASKFANLCPGNWNVSIESFTQQFAQNFLEEIFQSEQNDYFLDFGSELLGKFGVVDITSKSALAWSAQLLGDTEAQADADKELSELEESLLADIASGIVEALAKACDQASFQTGRGIVRKLMPLHLQGTEELCKISFTVKNNESQAYGACIMMLSEKLKNLIDKNPAGETQLSNQDAYKAIVEHLKDIPVSVTVQLASAEVCLKELLTMKPCDILLLDKKLDEPINLIVEGETIFRGRPAKTGDSYAMVITDDPIDDPNSNRSS